MAVYPKINKIIFDQINALFAMGYVVLMENFKSLRVFLFLQIFNICGLPLEKLETGFGKKREKSGGLPTVLNSANGDLRPEKVFQRSLIRIYARKEVFAERESGLATVKSVSDIVKQDWRRIKRLSPTQMKIYVR